MKQPRQKFKLSHVLFHTTPFEIYLSLRRRFLLRFRPSYVKKSIAKRKGDCQFPKCDCCFWSGCEYCIDYKKGCSIHENKPFRCDIYPIDKKDMIPRFTDCTYYWDDNNDS